MAWLEKIELNAAIDKANDMYDLSHVEEPCPDEVKKLIGDALKPSVWLGKYRSEIKACKSIAELNRILEAIYNDADRHRVWCGMPSFA